MTSNAFTDLYKESQDGPTAIDAGTYVVDVEAARANGSKVYLDLRIVGGGFDGKMTNVSIWVPLADTPTAKTYPFRKNMAGFTGLEPVFAAMDAETDHERVVEILAAALPGRRVQATLTIRGDDAGDYAGSQDLNGTKPADSPAPAPVQAPQPEMQPDPTPQETADELALLRRKVAEAEAEAAKGDTVVAAAIAAEDEPF